MVSYFGFDYQIDLTGSDEGHIRKSRSLSTRLRNLHDLVAMTIDSLSDLAVTVTNLINVTKLNISKQNDQTFWIITLEKADFFGGMFHVP